MDTVKFLLPSNKRLVLLLLTYILGYMITVMAGAALSFLGGAEKATAMLRISTVVQDVFMLVLPAVITAVIATRNPAGLLAVSRFPSWKMVLVAIAVMILSSPLMTWIIRLNASIHLPESLAGLEDALRTMENNASSAVETVLGAHSIPNLIMSLLIVGILAGFSEELLFRGALQRLLGATRLSQHAAVWIAAVIFSVVHFQFFGFVPRMLLGAFFGYLLLWSGSVWLPMTIHMINNSMFIILRYTTGSGDYQVMPEAPAWIPIIISTLLTVAGLWWLYKNRKENEKC